MKCKHETTTEVCSECKAEWVWVNEGKMPPTGEDYIESLDELEARELIMRLEDKFRLK